MSISLGRNNGVLIAKFGGTTTAYSIDKLQDRGRFFIEPGEEVYIGQVLAEHIKPGDLNINAVEMKKLTNHRASGSDDSVRITPKTQFTLEECMEYIQQDECIEVTPKSVRMRKTHLDENDRKNASRSNG
jgi:GTP-binding protein